MRKIKKGSFTIEAALLMPLVLMILIGVLYLDFLYMTEHISLRQLMRQQSAAVWKDIKRKGTYMKRQIYREECWEVSGCWEERILACRQMREKQ